MIEQTLHRLSETNEDAPIAKIDNGLRSGWQWVAMVTMLADHVGFMYYQYNFLRYAGRLAMPLYAMLFVMTIRSGHVRPWRLLLLAAVSQVPYLLIFYPGSLRGADLNIIFGFLIFYWLTAAIEKRHWLGIVLVTASMCIPISYGWYLYTSMAAFYWLEGDRRKQWSAFALLTIVYTWMTSVHPRQLLAICVPFIRGIKLPRPNQYLYRYFYPGHLLVLVVVDVLIMGYLVTPFGTFGSPPPDNYDDTEYEYYDETYDDNHNMLLIDDMGELIIDSCIRKTNDG